MNTVLISLASNTPDKLRQMNNAFAELQEMGLVAASSSIYETVACGSIKSPNYLNAVVKIFTDTDHQELHNVLKTTSACFSFSTAMACSSSLWEQPLSLTNARTACARSPPKTVSRRTGNKITSRQDLKNWNK